MGNEEVRERADGEGELARRLNKKARDGTHFLAHKSTLLSKILDSAGRSMDGHTPESGLRVHN